MVNAIKISKASFRRIKINFVWAFLYNIILIPIAMGVLYPRYGFKLDPMLAGAAMALSSISVVLSSLILKMFTPFTIKEDTPSFHPITFKSNEKLLSKKDSLAYSSRVTPLTEHSYTRSLNQLSEPLLDTSKNY